MRLWLYTLKNLLYAMGFVSAALTGVMWLVQSLKIMDLAIGSDAPLREMLALTVLALPSSLEIILPVALVIAVLFTYNKMLSENELVIMRACGISSLKLAAPALSLCGLTTLVLLIITTYASPLSLRAVASMKQQLQSAYAGVLLHEGVFNSFGNDLTVYVRSHDEAKGFTGVIIYDTRDKKNPPVTIIAKSGDIVSTDIGTQFRIRDGVRQQIDPSRGAPSRLYFSSYVIDMNSAEKPAAARWQKADERTLRELLSPDPSDIHARESRVHFIGEANDRLVSPFGAFSLTLPLLALLLLGPFNRRGQPRKLLAAVALIVAQEGLQLSLINGVKTHLSLLAALYLLVFIPILAGFYLLTPSGEAMAGNMMRLANRRRLRRFAADDAAAALTPSAL